MSELAWHFVGDRLRDASPIPPDDEWLVHEGEVGICRSGLHASLDPFDAVQFAPGNVLCRVEVDDVIDRHDDKLVCRRRRIIQRRNVEPMLRAFAREQALSVSHLWQMPDVVRRYLETGDESLRDAARAAVWAAARAAADAARAAAQAAARAAARAAADAARAAAQAAAWAAADAAQAAQAARAAAQAAANATDAALPAARAAAQAAAWAATRKRFNEMVNEEFGLS